MLFYSAKYLGLASQCSFSSAVISLSTPTCMVSICLMALVARISSNIFRWGHEPEKGGRREQRAESREIDYQSQ